MQQGRSMAPEVGAGAGELPSKNEGRGGEAVLSLFSRLLPQLI